MMRRVDLVGALCLVLGCGGAPPSKGTAPEETGGEGGVSGTGGAGGQTAPKPDASFALSPDVAAMPDTSSTGGSAGGPEVGVSEPDASPDVAPPLGPFPLDAVKAGRATLFGRVSTHTEGPTFREGSVYFASDGNGLVRADETGKVWKYHPRLQPVGTALLADGTLLVCDKTYIVVQIFKDGTLGSLLSAADRNRIPFCNDLSVDPKGNIFFTSPRGAGDVWRLSVDGTLDRVATDLGYPNGVEVDREGTALYITRQANLLKVNLPATGNTFEKPQPVGPGGGDGLAFDVWGNLWLANWGDMKIEVFDPVKKQVIASIAAGGGPTNLCFVDDLVYVTVANRGLSKIPVPGIRGFLHPGAPKYTIKQMLDFKPVNDPL